MARTMSRYGMRYEVLFPDAAAVEEMVSGEGPNLFYASVAEAQCAAARCARWSRWDARWPAPTPG